MFRHETRESILTGCLSYLLAVGALSVFIIYLWRNADAYEALLSFPSESLFPVLGLVLVTQLGNGLLNYYTYRALGVALTFNEAVGLAAVNTLANQLPLAGGILVKGAYLKRRHKLAYARFLSATLALYVVFVAVNGILGITVLVYLHFIEPTPLPMVLVLGFSGMAASVSLLWLPIHAVSRHGKWGQRLARLLKSWQALRRDRFLLGRLVGVWLTISLTLGVRYWIVLRGLSQQPRVAECVLFASAAVLTQLVNVTPGGLGVREGIVAGVAAILGFDPGISAIAVGIDRLVVTSVIAFLGALYTYVLGERAGAPLDDIEGCGVAVSSLLERRGQ